MINRSSKKPGGGWGGVITILLLFSICFPADTVNAQTVTPEPLYPTPTGIGEIGACPVGTPLPTPLTLEYYQNCAECVPDTGFDITPLPFGEFGITPFATSTPGITPTPTVSPTPDLNDFSSFVTARMDSLAWTLIPFPPDTYLTHSQLDKSYSVFYPYNFFMYATGGMNSDDKYYYASVKFDIDVIWDYRSGAGSMWRSYDIEYQNSNARLIELDFDLDGIYEVQLNFGQKYSEQILYDNHQNNQAHESRLFNIIVHGSSTSAVNFVINFDDSGNIGYGNDVTLGIEWHQYLSDIPEPEPTITPTPGAGYCSEYDYMGDDDETLLDFGGIDIWQGECLVIIPNFTIDLPAVGELIPAVNWGINGFSICPKWVTLGTFEILQIEIPMDILGLPAVIFLLLLIFRM